MQLIDARWRDIGVRMLSLVSKTLEALSLWPFEHVLGMAHLEVVDLVMQARREMNNLELRLYVPL